MNSPAGTAYTPTLNNLKGIFWMLAAVTMLTLMFVIIKQMTLELPVFVVAIARTFFSLILLTPWLMRQGTRNFGTRRMGLHFLRSFCGIAAFVCVVFALESLILADVMVLAFTSPFFSILISILFLHEAVRGNRIAAAVVGFCGVVMIVKPQGGIEPAMLLALLAALLTSLAMISMKRLSATEPPTRIVFYFMLFGTLILAPGAALTWETPTFGQWGWLFLAGTFGAVGQECLARAYDAGEISMIAPFDFMRLPLAALFGYIVFSEIPDGWSITGTCVVVASALYLMRRGAKERTPAAAVAPGGTPPEGNRNN